MQQLTNESDKIKCIDYKKLRKKLYFHSRLNQLTEDKSKIYLE